MAIGIERDERIAEIHRRRLLRDRQATLAPIDTERVDGLGGLEREHDLAPARLRSRFGLDVAFAPKTEFEPVVEREQYEVGRRSNRRPGEQFLIESSADEGIFDVEQYEVRVFHSGPPRLCRTGASRRQVLD